jgi:hypothetical protein
LKEPDGHWFHRAVRRLAEFFHGDDDKHAVTVYTLCFRFLFRRHLVLTRTSGIPGCRVPELGSQRFEQAAVHMRANHYERCTAYRAVCCRAQHARAVFRLSCVYIPVATLQ